MRRFRRTLACALTCALACAAAAVVGCKPAAPSAPATQPARLQPVTVALFWSEFTSPDQAKVAAALRLLAVQPEIADTPFPAKWSGGGLLQPGGGLGTWVLADGAAIPLDPTSLKHLDVSIDPVVAAIEPDASRHSERKRELAELVDRIGIAMWRAGADLERPGGGFFGESADERLARESALFALRSHALLLRHIVLGNHLEKMPSELVDQSDLERRREVLLEWRRIMLGTAPSPTAP